ncbi:unnamed protein product, partial [Didymodactylos carnosus]
HHWNYEEYGPNTWPYLYPQCGDSKQSPININTESLIYRQFEAFQFSSLFNSFLPFTLKNNGHTIIGEFDNSNSNNNCTLFVWGGNLPNDGPFCFTNFHLHWGSGPREGSEHTINGQRYSGEAHFVFKNSKTQQIAVLAFMILIGQSSSSSLWHSYVNKAVKLINEGETVQYQSNLMEMMGGTMNSFSDFYHYEGSLTTPPCTENVLWTIFYSFLYFSYDELQLLSLNVLHKDFRPVQPINERLVFR